MGHSASKESLVTRWAALLHDPSLQDLPYKIEINQDGTIEMGPASNRHGMMQAQIARELGNALANGSAITECSVLTEIGVRVPDVAWGSEAFLAVEAANTPFRSAPEICVEIRSPSNTEHEFADKIRAYLKAGAVEVWIVDEDGGRHFHSAAGPQQKSRYLP